MTAQALLDRDMRADGMSLKAGWHTGEGRWQTIRRVVGGGRRGSASVVQTHSEGRDTRVVPGR